MKKEVLYTYLGTNGTICSPVHLEGIYYTCKIKLYAAADKKLTKDGKTFHKTVIITENELSDWYEV